MPLLISKLQRDVFDMHQSTISSWSSPDWKCGLFCNVNKFPLDPDAHSELIELGLRTSCQDFLQIGLWGFTDNLVVMKPPKPL